MSQGHPIVCFANATPFSFRHSMPDVLDVFGANKENVRPSSFTKTEDAVCAVHLDEPLNYDQLWAVVNRHVYRSIFQDFCNELQRGVGALQFDFTANGQDQCLHTVLLYYRHYLQVPEFEPLNDASAGMVSSSGAPVANDAPTLAYLPVRRARSMGSRVYLGDLAKEIVEEFDAIKTRYRSGSMFLVPDIVTAMGHVRAARLCELLKLFAREQSRRRDDEEVFSGPKILNAHQDLIRFAHTMHMLQRGQVRFENQAVCTQTLDILAECARHGVNLSLRMSGRDALLDSDYLAIFERQPVIAGRDAVSILVALLRNRLYTDLRYHLPNTDQGAFEDYAAQLLDRCLVEYCSAMEHGIFECNLGNCAWMRNRLCDALEIYFASIRASLAVIKLESLVGHVRFHLLGVKAQSKAQQAQDQQQAAATGGYATVFASTSMDAA